MLVDVLLSRALMADHLPADEILIGHHDAEAGRGLRDPLHLLEALAHVEEVLQGSQTGDVVERSVTEREGLPRPDGDLGSGRDALREPDGFIGEIDTDGFDTAIARRREQRAGPATDVEEATAGRRP